EHRALIAGAARQRGGLRGVEVRGGDPNPGCADRYPDEAVPIDGIELVSSATTLRMGHSGPSSAGRTASVGPAERIRQVPAGTLSRSAGNTSPVESAGRAA